MMEKAPIRQTLAAVKVASNQYKEQTVDWVVKPLELRLLVAVNPLGPRVRFLAWR